MDLRQLNAIVAVADHGSFSAAARALHTVQSNISTHIARLEQELSTTLVDRGTGTLTEAGDVAVARARRLQAELEALAADVASLNAEVTGEVRIGVIGTTARWLVPALVDGMAAAHPRVHMIVVDATTTSLLPQLETGDLDLAIVNLPINDPDIHVDELFDEDRVLVAPVGHPLYDFDKITLADLDGEPLLLEPQGTNFRDLLDAQAADAGVHLTAQAEVDGMRLLASLAFQGFGAALLPASAAPGWVGGEWRKIPVENVVGRTVGIARRRKGLLSAPARALRDIVIHIVAATAGEQAGIHPLVHDPVVDPDAASADAGNDGDAA
jgi:LysR family hydrogen peroxide-inducible transcriptional activator